MKIALLHYSVPPVVGGVESVIGHHAKLMADDGHQVILLAGRGETVDPRIQVEIIPLADSRAPEILAVKRSLDAGDVPPSFHSLVSSLIDELDQRLSDVDVLIVHNVASLNKNLPLTAALKSISIEKKHPRFVLWHHDLAWTTERYLPELHPGYPWNLLSTDWKGSIQVTISESRRQELASLLNIPIEKVKVIPNGIDAAGFLKLEIRTRDLLARLQLMRFSPFFLLPVRITPRKNIELALRIIAALNRSYPSAGLVVTGPLGPHNPANVDYFHRLLTLRQEFGLESQAIFLAEHVKEFLSDAVIADFYQLADALLFPSREEGFGIPILEAGLAGLPIFCSDIQPLHELGENQVTYFSPDGNPDQIAELIQRRFENDPVIGLRCRVKQDFTWERIYSEQIKPLLMM